GESEERDEPHATELNAIRIPGRDTHLGTAARGHEPTPATASARRATRAVPLRTGAFSRARRAVRELSSRRAPRPDEATPEETPTPETTPLAATRSSTRPSARGPSEREAPASAPPSVAWRSGAPRDAAPPPDTKSSVTGPRARAFE